MDTLTKKVVEKAILATKTGVQKKYFCEKKLTNNIHFPFQQNAKFSVHTVYDLRRKTVHFFARCPAMVHQNERLVLPCSGISNHFSFPSALFYQPPGSQLY